jgi:antitoxin ParD1/3/4
LAIFAKYGIIARVNDEKEKGMPTRNINLTELYDQFVEEQVETGRYKNASEVLRAGLRLLQQQTQTEEEKLTLLKKLATDGFRSLDQGQGLSVVSENGLRTVVAQIGRRAEKATKAQHGE